MDLKIRKNLSDSVANRASFTAVSLGSVTSEVGAHTSTIGIRFLPVAPRGSTPNQRSGQVSSRELARSRGIMAWSTRQVSILEQANARQAAWREQEKRRGEQRPQQQQQQQNDPPQDKQSRSSSSSSPLEEKGNGKEVKLPAVRVAGTEELPIGSQRCFSGRL